MAAESPKASAVSPRRIIILIFDGVQALDVAGPVEIFAGANELVRFEGGVCEPYRLELWAPEPGPVRTFTGMTILADFGLEQDPGTSDTLLVAGGLGLRGVLRDPRIRPWLQCAAVGARRTASVCNGAFLLAEAGLLKGRRATTHWAACKQLGDRYPEVEIEKDSIYVRDGPVWTSAGVSAGMDLALAMVEEDLGRRLALALARWLVLFLKRPGGQAQFSSVLATQSAESLPLQELQDWIPDHLVEDLSVPVLAGRVSMSPRNFSRVFKREVGVTPGRYVESLRVEAARTLLEDTDLGVRAIAGHCGFGTQEVLRRAFLRTKGVAPTAYRSRFKTRLNP